MSVFYVTTTGNTGLMGHTGRLPMGLQSQKKMVHIFSFNNRRYTSLLKSEGKFIEN